MEDDVGTYCGAFEDGQKVPQNNQINDHRHHVEEGDKTAEYDAQYNQVMMVHNMTEIKRSFGTRERAPDDQGLKEDASGELLLMQ